MYIPNLPARHRTVLVINLVPEESAPNARVHTTNHYTPTWCLDLSNYLVWESAGVERTLVDWCRLSMSRGTLT